MLSPPVKKEVAKKNSNEPTFFPHTAFIMTYSVRRSRTLNDLGLARSYYREHRGGESVKECIDVLACDFQWHDRNLPFWIAIFVSRSITFPISLLAHACTALLLHPFTLCISISFHLPVSSPSAALSCTFFLLLRTFFSMKTSPLP